MVNVRKMVMGYDDRPDAAKRLEKARILRGFKTPKDAARYFGWSYETYIQHEHGTRGISRAAGRYAKAFKVSEAWLLTGEGNNIGTLQVRDNWNTIGLEVVGTIQAGQFRDITLDNQDTDHERIGVGRDGRFPNSKQYALLVSGDSMDLKFPDGCYVTCVDYIDSGIELKPGMSVHVERSVAGTHLVETTLKEIQHVNGEIILIPRSSNPKHKPVAIEGDESVEISIRGVVTGMWVPQSF